MSNTETKDTKVVFQLIKIPEPSYPLYKSIYFNKKINSDAKVILTRVIGLMNVSLNHGKKGKHSFYNFTDGYWYVSLPIKRITSETGMSRYHAKKALKQLSDNGLIIRYNHNHYTATRLSPEFEQYYSLNNSISTVDNRPVKNHVNNRPSQRSNIDHGRRSNIDHRNRSKEARIKNTRSKEDVVRKNLTTKNKQHRKQSNSSKNISIKYKMGLPENVIKLIINNSNNSYKAQGTVFTILNIRKDGINSNHIKDQSYRSNEHCPYIQDGSLFNDLKHAYDNNKDIKDTITDDFQTYINNNYMNRGMASGVNQQSPQDKINDAKEDIDKLENGMKYTKNDKDKKKIQDQIQVKAHTIIDNCAKGGEAMWDIKFTREWWKQHKLHPTDPKVVAKIQKQLADLDKNKNYTDANGTEHVTVNHKNYKPKPKTHIDFHKFMESEENDNGNENIEQKVNDMQTVPSSNDDTDDSDDDLPF